MKILKKLSVVVQRKECNFDRACDEAHSQSMLKLGCDEDGYLSNCPEWQRSTDSIVVMFVSYKTTGGMGGWWHEYIFECSVVRDI